MDPLTGYHAIVTFNHMELASKRGQASPLPPLFHAGDGASLDKPDNGLSSNRSNAGIRSHDALPEASGGSDTFCSPDRPSDAFLAHRHRGKEPSFAGEINPLAHLSHSFLDSIALSEKKTARLAIALSLSPTRQVSAVHSSATAPRRGNSLLFPAPSAASTEAFDGRTSSPAALRGANLKRNASAAATAAAAAATSEDAGERSSRPSAGRTSGGVLGMISRNFRRAAGLPSSPGSPDVHPPQFGVCWVSPLACQRLLGSSPSWRNPSGPDAAASEDSSQISQVNASMSLLQPDTPQQAAAATMAHRMLLALLTLNPELQAAISDTAAASRKMQPATTSVVVRMSAPGSSPQGNAQYVPVLVEVLTCSMPGMGRLQATPGLLLYVSDLPHLTVERPLASTSNATAAGLPRPTAAAEFLRPSSHRLAPLAGAAAGALQLQARLARQLEPLLDQLASAVTIMKWGG